MESTGMQPVSDKAAEKVGLTEAAASAPDPGLAVVLAVTPVTGVKRKRGRPRKYIAADQSPAPVSAPANEPSGMLESPAETCFAGQPLVSPGAAYTKHVLTVNPGEDVIMKIHSLSQGSRAIFVILASGLISSFTVRQPKSSGGTVTYEGCFELVTLFGSFVPTETAGMVSRSGGLSVIVLTPDRRELGGALSGCLVAASPVQVMVGTFLPENTVGDQLKKKRPVPCDAYPTQFTLIPTHNIVFGEGFERLHGDENLNFAPANTTQSSESKEVNGSCSEVSC